MSNIYTRTVLVSSIVTDIGNGDTYNLALSIQRRSKIWNRKSMSLFVDSILRDYPIYPALVSFNTETNKNDVIDFKQRFETIYDFAKDRFALTNDLQDVWYKNSHYEIAGKKFSELDEEMQRKFMERELVIYKLTDVTDDEISDIFDRINNGSPLCNGHKRSTVESKPLRTALHKLVDCEFFNVNLSNPQYKRNFDKDSILEALMLYYDGKGYELNSFKNNDINKFIEFFNAQIANEETQDDAMKVIGAVQLALEALSDTFTTEFNEENGVKLKSLCLPFIIYSALETIIGNANLQEYEDKIKEFAINYAENEDFLQYCKTSTANTANVRGRLDYFKKNILV